MWINPDFVTAHENHCPNIKKESLPGRIITALSNPVDIMEINWISLEEVTGIGEGVWDLVHQEGTWYYNGETEDAREELRSLLKEIPTTPLKDYL